MNTFIYALGAITTVALPMRAWLEDRQNPVRQAFLWLGINLAFTYIAFAAYLASALSVLRLSCGIGAAFLPLTFYTFFTRFFRVKSDFDQAVLSGLRFLAPVVAILYVLGETTVFSSTPRASTGSVLLALFAFGGIALSLARLTQLYFISEQRVDRIRMHYLLALMGAALMFSTAESLARAWVSHPPAGSLDILTGPVVLQGAVPPVGVLFTGLLFYFLYQILVLSRLLDLHEIASRLITLGICGAVLVTMEVAVVVWNDTLSHSTAHGTFLIFLAGLLFLVIYDPLRRQVEHRTHQWFNRRGRILDLTLGEIESNLSSSVDMDTLVEGLLSPLAASGRAPYSALYLWDDIEQRYQIMGFRGKVSGSPMPTVPSELLEPFRDKVLPTLVYQDLSRRSEREGDSTTTHSIRLLIQLHADLLIPIHAGTALLGWICLEDEPWSDGFSQEEINKLVKIVERVAVILDNIQGLQHIQEQRRLAALGTMSAGLAQEIRSPLAGIKEAAQELLASTPQEPSSGTCGADGSSPGLEPAVTKRNSQPPATRPHLHGNDSRQTRNHLELIVDETERLDNIVNQFLTYAKPYRPRLVTCRIPLIIRRARMHLAHHGLPPAVRLREDIRSELPDLRADEDGLEQVLVNLLDNAVEELAPTGGTITVAARQDWWNIRNQRIPVVIIQVHDTGRGIPREDQDKLFIPFFSTRNRGTGLGLPVCRRIVEAHKGEINVHSEAGKGTRFIVTLPLSV